MTTFDDESSIVETILACLFVLLHEEIVLGSNPDSIQNEFSY